MNRATTLAPMAAALLVLLPAPAVHGGVLVTGTVTPLGGSYRYEASVHNPDLEDYFLVSFTDAPLADPLIDASLTTPAGFVGNYDEGLGVVDLLSDVESFAPGTTSGPFSFESLGDPTQAFASVESYFLNPATQTIDTVPGTVRWTVVPEPAATGVAMAVGLLGGLTVLRTRSPRNRSHQPKP